MNYIGRYEVDFYVSNQCLSLFESFGLAGAWNCYDCTLYTGDWIGKVCIYTDPRVSENPLYFRTHLDCVGWDDDDTCQCPGLSFLDRLCDVSMTSWCLNSSNLTIHGKCFVKSNYFLKQN